MGVGAEFAVASAASLDERMANETMLWEGETAAEAAEAVVGTMAVVASARVKSEAEMAAGLMVAATVMESQVEERQEDVVAMGARC